MTDEQIEYISSLKAALRSPRASLAWLNQHYPPGAKMSKSVAREARRLRKRLAAFAKIVANEKILLTP